ncbi:unnamed protein product [Parajaminaea phylloscopi]
MAPVLITVRELEELWQVCKEIEEREAEEDWVKCLDGVFPKYFHSGHVETFQDIVARIFGPHTGMWYEAVYFDSEARRLRGP